MALLLDCRPGLATLAQEQALDTALRVRPEVRERAWLDCCSARPGVVTQCPECSPPLRGISRNDVPAPQRGGTCSCPLWLSRAREGSARLSGLVCPSPQAAQRSSQTSGLEQAARVPLSPRCLQRGCGFPKPKSGRGGFPGSVHRLKCGHFCGLFPENPVGLVQVHSIYHGPVTWAHSEPKGPLAAGAGREGWLRTK